MALTAADILTPVSEVLLDESNVRWSSASLLRYLNEAQRAIVDIEPAAGITTAIAQLEQGTVRQTLSPTDGRVIKKMPRNINSISLPGFLFAESMSNGAKLYRTTVAGPSLLASMTYNDYSVKPTYATWQKFVATKNSDNSWKFIFGGSAQGFTTNSFAGELFYLWTTDQIDNKTPYIPNYPSRFYDQDYFLTHLAGNGSTSVMTIWSGGTDEIWNSVLPAGTFWDISYAGTGETLIGPMICSNTTFWQIENQQYVAKSTNGVNFTDTGEVFSPATVETFVNFNDGGALVAIGGAQQTYGWFNSAGVYTAATNPLPSGYEFCKGINLDSKYGYEATQGYTSGTKAYALIRNTSTGQIKVCQASALDDFANLTGSNVGSTGSRGIGIFDLGGGNFYVVLDTGVYTTSDFSTFTLVQSPAGGQKFIGAGQYFTYVGTMPSGWTA